MLLNSAETGILNRPTSTRSSHRSETKPALKSDDVSEKKSKRSSRSRRRSREKSRSRSGESSASSRERRSPSIRRRRGSPSHLDRRRITRWHEERMRILRELETFCCRFQCSKATDPLPPTEHVTVDRQRPVDTKSHASCTTATSQQCHSQVTHFKTLAHK